MGAVNTVRRDGDRLIGENTDGKGFLRSLREDAQTDPAGKRVVVLGAGGAARAITVELALAEAAFVAWNGAYAIPADTEVLVNATSIGLFPNVHDRPEIVYDTITAEMIVCDVIPNPPQTPFLAAARERGAQTLDGLGMLVYQGAIGFTMWTGREVPVAVMHRALQQAFQ